MNEFREEPWWQRTTLWCGVFCVIALGVGFALGRGVPREDDLTAPQPAKVYPRPLPRPPESLPTVPMPHIEETTLISPSP